MPGILVAEQDEAARARLEVLLREAGYHVISAWDGAFALNQCAVQHPDLVVLGLSVDGPDAFQVCSRIKHDSRLRWTPVLMATPPNADHDRERGVEAGADAFLNLPFERSEVLASVRLMLGMHGKAPLELQKPPAKATEGQSLRVRAQTA